MLARRGGIPPVEGQRSRDKVKGRPWRIGHEPVAPLADRSCTSDKSRTSTAKFMRLIYIFLSAPPGG